ncbi:hypothetical protein [Microbacterium paludicola]|uniref:hypothetical protein n=1 Tax=Microbacterium paludicola TaxID=300019 RepID=UPI003CD09E83
MIVFHLRNGASACALAAGRSVATSMGMTPLEGLVMGHPRRRRRSRSAHRPRPSGPRMGRA